VTAHCFHRGQPWFAFGQRPGLVDDQRIDLLHDFQGLGVLDENSSQSAAPGSNHDRHGRRQAEGAWARDDEHSDGVDQRVRHAWLGAQTLQAMNASVAAPTTVGTNHADT